MEANSVANSSGLPPSNGLVVLVHGIETRAEWMNDVSPELARHGFTVSRASYGRMTTLEFLLPIEHYRRKAIERDLGCGRKKRK